MVHIELIISGIHSSESEIWFCVIWKRIMVYTCEIWHLSDFVTHARVIWFRFAKESDISPYLICEYVNSK